ncbi:MAG: hypothetical protein Q4G52_08130 [Clostridia bacterium]|nr:hypothetical protein [Clostridia bacterium]
MMTMPWRETLYSCLTPQAAKLLRDLSEEDAAGLEEMRFRTGRPVEFVIAGRSRDGALALDQQEMGELLGALSGYSLYAFEKQMAMGFIPLAGGHRAGVCGKVVEESGQAVRMSAITSICLRVARAVPGASAPIRPHFIEQGGRVRRVLLLGAPGCGKTTVLRDAALYLSDACGVHVAVADERGELFARLPEGKGHKLDVLSGASKALATQILLRSMSPDAIVTDEIGHEEDVGALLEAARCGVGLLASAHAEGMRGVTARPALSKLFEARAFDRYIHLGRRAHVLGIYDEAGRLCRKEET